MDHFSVSSGVYSRLYCPMKSGNHTNNIDYMIEPFNMLWSLEGRLRKDCDFWNLGIRISNFDDFHIERTNQPIFTLLADYRSVKNLRLFSEIYCEPSGIFHMAANFYKAGIRLGITYSISR